MTVVSRRSTVAARSPEARYRSTARRDALTALYEAEFGQRSPREILDRRIAAGDIPSEVAPDALGLVDLVQEQRAQLDTLIAQLAPAFPLETMHKIERSLLRCGLAEVLHSRAATPAEAIAAWTALARTYSGEPARKMVNGVLGTAHREGADSVKDGGSPT